MLGHRSVQLKTIIARILMQGFVPAYHLAYVIFLLGIRKIMKRIITKTIRQQLGDARKNHIYEVTKCDITKSYFFYIKLKSKHSQL